MVKSIKKNINYVRDRLSRGNRQLASISNRVNNLPDSPGVYIMKSHKGEILYVGKAVSLRKRVASYFRKNAHDIKTNILTEKVRGIDFILCDTEAQALILEASLIKEKKPKYNINLRDDKSYPYIAVTNEDFPRVFPIRPKKKTNLFLFGPYPNVRLIKEALKLIRGIFPYRSCKSFPKTPCLYYHLNLCPAPCAGRISSREYKNIIRGLSKILSGDKETLIKEFENKMLRASKSKHFEEAAFLRDKIVALKSIYSGKNNIHEIVYLKDILRLRVLPLKIEAIDISNISGRQATGSVVVFTDGLPDKGNYRRFRIKEKCYHDDCRMIEEVVARHFRSKDGYAKLPQLLIIDGGRGQVSSASKVLKSMRLDIAVVGIAKRNEELWLEGADKPLVIPKDNPALQLIQRIRDEAHRFAHKYHILLRKKMTLNR